MEYARNQCPARGPGLTHTMNGYNGDPCTECGVPITMEPPRRDLPPSASEATMIDVAARMRSLGFSGAYRDIRGEEHEVELPKPLRDSDRDNVPVEPKMITGKGPEGPTYGQGRGGLSPRQKDRLIRVAEQEAWIDEQRATGKLK